MKKIFAIAAVASLCAALLAGCGSTATASSAASETVSQAASAVSEAVDQANTDLLESAVAAIEAVNPVNNPRVIDDFSLVNEMGLSADNIVAYKGDVTNDQADCGLVFAVQAKPGKAADVEAELNAYKDSLAANDLYAEFADKVAQDKDARIVSKGDCVVLVIAGVGGPDYADIDTAIAAALN